jgi:hypothetical protein
MSNQLLGVLTYPNGYKLVLSSNPNRAGRRERVYAALCAARAPELLQNSTEFEVAYQPHNDSFSIIYDNEVGSYTQIHAKVGLEENAALEELAKLGCSYKEIEGKE